MNRLAKYLDSTYLKTASQSGLSEEETIKNVIALTDEAIAEDIYAVMIRPEYVRQVKEYIRKHGSQVKVGTVIGFHEGTASAQEKFNEAAKAIEDGADDLDFVVNFEAFKKGDEATVKDEFLKCTKLGIDSGKTVKWIIEVAALSGGQIADITKKIATWASENFSDEAQSRIFVKSSTGFYQTEAGKPNGATVEAIKIMKENAGKLPIKAAGGVRNAADAKEMIALGVTRIGTSSAKALLAGGKSTGY